MHEMTNLVRRNVHTFLFSSEFMLRTTERFWGQGAFRGGKLRNPFHSPAVPAAFLAGEYALFVGRLSEEKGLHY